MQPRIDYYKTPSGATKAMLDLQHYVDKCGLEPALAISFRWLAWSYRPQQRSSKT